MGADILTVVGRHTEVYSVATVTPLSCSAKKKLIIKKNNYFVPAQDCLQKLALKIHHTQKYRQISCVDDRTVQSVKSTGKDLKDVLLNEKSPAPQV